MQLAILYYGFYGLRTPDKAAILNLHLSRDRIAVHLDFHDLKLLKLDNLREDWHRALMEAYARLGRRATALEQYELCRQVLGTE